MLMLKGLVQSIYFNSVSFAFGIVALGAMKRVPEPESYVLKLVLNTFQVICFIYFLKELMKKVPTIFSDVQRKGDDFFIITTGMLLVDWELLNQLVYWR